jgi:type IV secretory pathway VirB2 component (pilin)
MMIVRNGLVLPRTVTITKTRMGSSDPTAVLPWDSSLQSFMNSIDGTVAAISVDA